MTQQNKSSKSLPLNEERVWRGLQLVLTVIGISVAGWLSFQQMKISEGLVNLNFRPSIGFQYDEKTGIAHFMNYSDGAIYIDAARLNTIPKIAFSMVMQKTIFPKTSIEIDMKNQLAAFNKNSTDGMHAALYMFFLQIDTPSGRKNYVGNIGLSYKINKGSIEDTTPSSNIWFTEYSGTALDFTNLNQ